MPGSVIASSARTPIGKLSGALASFSAMDLGGIAIKAALERAGVTPDQVDYVIMGQVLQAGQGQITARQAAAKAGIPMDVPAITVNKVCLSGINAIYMADQMIQAGDAEIVVAGGMESMTSAPYLLPKARAGYRMGNGKLVDIMIHDGLWDPYGDKHMGNCAELCAAKYNFSRQDERVMINQRYDTPEKLSSTDAEVIQWRRLVVTKHFGGRDAFRKAQLLFDDQRSAQRHRKQHAEQAAEPDDGQRPPVIETRPVMQKDEGRQSKDRAGSGGA